jgi:hypothetical protein
MPERPATPIITPIVSALRRQPSEMDSGEEKTVSERLRVVAFGPRPARPHTAQTSDS